MDEITTEPPTKKRKCWIAFDLLYIGYGASEELAMLDLYMKTKKHLHAMAAIPKIDNGSSDTD